jgi:hypothetical protein
MMHLTATTPATAIGRFLAPDPQRRKHPFRTLPTCNVFTGVSPIVRSPTANSLEMRCRGFHYSVIVGHATDLTASEFVCCRLRDGPATAPSSGVAAFRADTQAGYERRLKSNQTGHDFEPA